MNFGLKLPTTVQSSNVATTHTQTHTPLSYSKQLSIEKNPGVLGIPFLDVVRVLAAVLLLGNLQFHETNGGGGQCETHEAELKAVAGLLGVTPASLLRGLTMRTHNVRGQLVKSICDANMVTFDLI